MKKPLSSKDTNLLPSGFQDVLPPVAAAEAKTVSRLVRTLELWGYEQVKPPLLEFAHGEDATISKQTFHILDPESGQMMGLRTDMTPQVARIAALRLKARPRPLRISYSGQVLRVKGEGLYADRQLAQVGAELIGESALAADAEVVRLAIEALEETGLKGISVDFSIPALQALLIPVAEAGLAELIEKKDTVSLKKAAGAKNGAMLAALIGTAGEADAALTKIKKIALPEKARAAIRVLEDLIKLLRESGVPCTLTIDPLERKGFEYHTGIAFSFFARGSTEELGRGGRYVLAATGEDAVGFSLNVNALQRALPAAAPREKVYVPFGEDASALRKKGTAAVQGLVPVKNAAAEAKRLGCTQVLENGKLKKLRQ